MVTIERLLPYSYWIGHPVSNRAIVYSFIGFVPLNYTAFITLKYILLLNTIKWGRKCQLQKLDLMRMGISQQGVLL